MGKKRESAAPASRASPTGAGEHAPTPLRTSPQARLPSRVAYCARRTGPSLLALAKSSGVPARVRRAHALLPAPSALYRAAPGEEEIDLSLPELFATRPFNWPRPGRQCCCRAARPRLRELSGAVRAASRPGRPACRYEVQCAQPPVGGEWGGVAARLRQGCRVSSEPAPHVPRAWKPRPQEITPQESGQKPRPYGLRTASFRVRLRSLKGIPSRVNRTARGWGRALERPHFRIIKHCS